MVGWLPWVVAVGAPLFTFLIRKVKHLERSLEKTFWVLFNIATPLI